MTGSWQGNMLHAGGKASALSSFSLEVQKVIEQSPQRWCGGSEVQRTPPWSWESASEQYTHWTVDMTCVSTQAALVGARGRSLARGEKQPTPGSSDLDTRFISTRNLFDLPLSLPFGR